MSKPIAAALLISSLLAAAPAGASSGRSLCVGRDHGCYRSIQAAIDAAHDGDTIRLARGRFAGGITIDKSIRLAGAGARATLIDGGGPVVTIGEFLAPAQPTVAISGVSITGGVTTSSPQSQEFVGTDGVVALGGGIAIPPAADFAAGATLTLTDSIVSENRASSTATVPSNGAACPEGPCPFGLARGGGIDNWGHLTLTRTTVASNTASGVASDLNGGGISDWSTGSLTLIASRVTQNRAIASPSNGRYAEGGGIFTDPGAHLTIRDSDVSENAARLRSTLPYFVDGHDPIDMNANGGGIHLGDDATVAIDHTTLLGNLVSVHDPNGEPYAFDAALNAGNAAIELHAGRIEHNRTVAYVGSSADVGASGSAVDLNGPGTVNDTLIRHNATIVTSRTGSADANGAVYVENETEQPLRIRDSVIAGNAARAFSASGRASVQGAGLVNNGRLELRDDLIADNAGHAVGRNGSAQGGGIWNGTQYGAAPGHLALVGTTITRNVLTASAGLEVRGGGLFTAYSVTFDRSRIAGNVPDDCAGC